MMLRSMLAAAGLVFAGAALAADAPRSAPAFEQTPASGWIVTVRANASMSPKWQGSDEYSFMGFPTIGFRRAGAPVRWRSPDDGIGFAFVDTGVFEAGPVARIRSGRYNGSDRLLTGIHDVKWTVEGGAFGNFWITPNLRARAEVRHGFRGQDGLTAGFGLDLVVPVERWTFAIGPRLELADKKSMNTNFGVTWQDATWNRGVWVYRPDGGVKSYGVYSSVGYQFNEAWAATLHGGYNRLNNEAADSPIIKRFGSANQMTVGLQLAYSFPVSGF